MPTKDPHIALINAHEKLDKIKLYVRRATALIQLKAQHGIKLTEEDKVIVNVLRAEAIEQAKRIQDELYEELESHGAMDT